MNPTIPITYDALKAETRTGLSDEARIYWWSYFPKLTKGSNISSYPNIEEESLKRYQWSLKKVENKLSNHDNSNNANETLQLLLNQFDMEESGLIFPLISLLSEIISAKHVLFSLCYDIIEKRSWYLSASPADHRSKLFAFRDLVKSYMSSTATVLESINALDDINLNVIFIDLFSSIFKIKYIARILDSFLLEGNKVLHRFGIALLSLFKKQIKSNTFSNAAQFWEAVTSHGQSFTDTDFNNLCEIAYAVGKPQLTKLNKPMGLARSSIMSKEEKGLKKLGDSARLPLTVFSRFISKSSKPVENLCPTSLLLNPDTMSRLRSFLADDIAMEGFKCMFSTASDGWDIEAFYRRIEHLSPCILLLKTLQTHSVLGVFLSSEISPPSITVRGDGRCFCFRLDGPNPAAYYWVGKDDHKKRGGGSTSASASTRNQFAVCSLYQLSFGGSSTHGTNAIRLDTDLKSCTSGPSDTYGNTGTLVPEELQQPFIISEIEVLCGNRSVSEAVAGGRYQKRSAWATEKEEAKNTTSK